jgi:hypothetical protein
MKQEISNIVIDAGGYYDLAKMTKSITHKGVEYKYLASGLYRDVFVNYETKEVIKICKAKWALMHNVLEAEVYNESPKYCKDNIAVTRLEGEYVIQELLDIKVDCGNYFREIGYRTNADGSKTPVIFDCDIFLGYGSCVERPKEFNYFDVFSCFSFWGEKCQMGAKKSAVDKRNKQKEAIKKYFPEFDYKKFHSTGWGDTHQVFYDNVLIDSKIVKECGFDY